MNLETIGLISAGVLFTCFLWQHIVRINKVNIITPSKILQVVADELSRFFELAGTYFAWVSSWILRWLNLYEFGVTLAELFKPIWEIVFSWSKFIYGYWKETLSYASKWPKTILGSMLLLFSSFYGVRYYMFPEIRDISILETVFSLLNTVLKYSFRSLAILSSIIMFAVLFLFWNNNRHRHLIRQK